MSVAEVPSIPDPELHVRIVGLPRSSSLFTVTQVLTSLNALIRLGARAVLDHYSRNDFVQTQVRSIRYGSPLEVVLQIVNASAAALTAIAAVATAIQVFAIDRRQTLLEIRKLEQEASVGKRTNDRIDHLRESKTLNAEERAQARKDARELTDALLDDLDEVLITAVGPEIAELVLATMDKQRRTTEVLELPARIADAELLASYELSISITTGKGKPGKRRK